MFPKEDGEPGFSRVRLPHILISDSAAELGRFPALSIVEARSDLELSAIVSPHSDRAHHQSAASSALLMADHSRLSIVELLHFQKRLASAALVE